MKRDILFRVDANSKIGWGHFYRYLALARMLNDEFQISFAISQPSTEVMSESQRHNYDLIYQAESKGFIAAVKKLRLKVQFLRTSYLE